MVLAWVLAYSSLREMAIYAVDNLGEVWFLNSRSLREEAHESKEKVVKTIRTMPTTATLFHSTSVPKKDSIN